jgi:hypothetical protein
MDKFYGINRTCFDDNQINYLLYLLKIERKKLHRKRARLVTKLGGQLLLKEIDNKLELNAQLHKLLSGKYLPESSKMRVL